MKTKTTVIKVTKNQWGNFTGFIPKMESCKLVCDFDALEWLVSTLAKYPNAVISELSYFSLSDVMAHSNKYKV